MSGRLPATEAARLDALDESGALELEGDPVLDRLAEISVLVSGADSGLIAFVGADSEVIKAAYNLEALELPRSQGLAARVVEAGGSVAMELEKPPDAIPSVRAYAGAPVAWKGKEILGAVCVTSTRRQGFSPQAVQSLELIAGLSSEFLDLRRAADRGAQAEERARRLGGLIARILEAQEKERERVAFEVHEDSIQVLAAAGMGLDLFRRRLTDPEEIRALENLKDLVKTSIGRLRRLSSGLRPPTLEYGRLGSTIQGEVAKRSTEAGYSYDVIDRLRSEPEDPIRITVFRLVEETLNLLEGAKGLRFVEVTLEDERRGLAISILAEAPGKHLEKVTEGEGWAAVTQRAESLGGRAHVAVEPGDVLTFSYWLPLRRKR